MTYYSTPSGPDELYHHGIKGMKWGVRRFENTDGTLTEAGKKRYSDKQQKEDERLYGKRAAKRIRKRVEQGGEGVKSARHAEVERKYRRDAVKRKFTKAAKIVSVPAAAAATAYAYPKVFDKVTNWLNGRSRKIGGAIGDTKAQKKYVKAFNKNYIKIHNLAADRANKDLEAINRKYEKKMSKYSSWDKSPDYGKYVSEVEASWNKRFREATEDIIGKEPE